MASLIYPFKYSPFKIINLSSENQGYRSNNKIKERKERKKARKSLTEVISHSGLT